MWKYPLNTMRILRKQQQNTVTVFSTRISNPSTFVTAGINHYFLAAAFTNVALRNLLRFKFVDILLLFSNQRGTANEIISQDADNHYHFITTGFRMENTRCEGRYQNITTSFHENYVPIWVLKSKCVTSWPRRTWCSMNLCRRLQNTHSQKCILVEHSFLLSFVPVLNSFP